MIAMRGESDKFLSVRYTNQMERVTTRPGATRISAATRNSPLFRLPETVRAKIFTYAVTYEVPISIHKHSAVHAWYDSKGERLVRETWRFLPPLLRVCDQLLVEAAPLFYASNSFTTTITNGDLSELITWLRETDSSCLSMVNRLILRVEPVSFGDLLDMCSARVDGRIMQQSHALFIEAGRAGMRLDYIEVCEPKLRHIYKDVVLMDLDEDRARRIVSGWIDQLKKQLRVHTNDGFTARFDEVMSLAWKGTVEEVPSE